MKKLIVNVLLFTTGYLSVALAITTNYFLTDNNGLVNWIMEGFHNGIVAGIISVISIIMILLIVSVVPAYCGLLLIKQAFVPGLCAMLALKKGQVVEVVSDEEGNYHHFMIHLKLYPFDDKSKIIEVTFNHHQNIIKGHRYFFNGSGLISVLK